VAAADLWYGEGLGFGLARVALTPLSWLYGAGWQGYLATYRLGLKTAAEPHCPIVCVGNLVTGGSGKSPFALYLAQSLREMGYRVVISASGYGSPRSEAATLAPDGPLDPKQWGDEPAMVRWLAPHLPIVVGRRRVRAAEIVHERFPDAILLMDDGFQHLPLRKHLTLVLDDPKPLNPRCLPAGPYREPRSNRARADLVLPDRFTIERQPLRFANEKGEIQAMQGAYNLLCALGQPDKFVAETTAALGHPPEQVEKLGDHDPLDAGTLLARFPADRPIVTTAKDWVKLRERPDAGTRRFLIALQSVRAAPEEEFRAWLRTRLDALTEKSV